MRSMVWNGVGVVAAPVTAYEPVMNGTFWPMMILASSLSRVSSVGVDRMLALLSRLERPHQQVEVEDLADAGNR